MTLLSYHNLFKKVKVYLILIWIILLKINAQSEITNDSSLKLKNDSQYSKNLNLKLGLQYESFFNEIESQNIIDSKVRKLNYKNLNHLRLNVDHSGEYFKFSSYAKFHESINQKLNFIAFPEFYFFYNQGKQNGYQLVLGRKLSTWSELDSSWKLGLWNSQLRHEPLKTVEQGLLGLGILYTYNFFELEAHASLYSFPHQDHYEEVSPWSVVNPPEAISVFGKMTPIQYQIHKPEFSKIINQKGYSLRTKFFQENGLTLQFSHGLLPMNEFIIISRSKFKATDLPHVESQIQLTNLYHEVNALDFSYENKSLKYQFGGLSENIIPYALLGDSKSLTYPVLDKTQFYSHGLTLKLDPSFEFKISQIEKNGGTYTWMGKDAQLWSEKIKSRFGFKKKQKVDLSWLQKIIFKANHTFSLSREIVTQSEWISYLFKYKLPKSDEHWSLYGGFEYMYASENKIQSGANESEYVFYQNHDLVYGGFEYVY